MFGNRQRMTELVLRVEELEVSQRSLATAITTKVAADVERQLDELRQSVAEDPQRRVAMVIDSVGASLGDQLRRTLEELEALRRAVAELTALKAQLEDAARAGVCQAPRIRAQLGQIYQAKWTGYVSLYFDGGHTDSVALLVGDESPPDEVVCRLNTRNDINSYAGAVVRRGEFWMARSASDGPSGVKCVYTPFA